MIKTIQFSVVLIGEGRHLKIFHQNQKFLQVRTFDLMWLQPVEGLPWWLSR